MEKTKPLTNNWTPTAHLRKRFKELRSSIKRYDPEEDGPLSEWIEVRWPIFIERFRLGAVDLTFRPDPSSGQFIHITNTQTGTNSISIRYKALRKTNDKDALLINAKEFEYWAERAGLVPRKKRKRRRKNVLDDV